MAFTGNRPSKEEQAAREARAWELRCQGQSQAQIAAELGVTQQAVSALLKRLARQFARDFSKRAEEIKADQTVRLEWMIDEAIAEWHRSKLDTHKESVKSGIQKLDKDGCAHYLDDEVTTTTEGRLADPRYLQQVLAGLADIRKIWGVDAPEKSEVEQKVTGEVTITAAAQDEAANKLEQWRKQQQNQLSQTRSNSPLAPPTAPTSPTTSAE